MPVSIAFIKELETIDPKLRRVLLSMLEELERQREESVTKKEFNELKEIVRKLGKSINELAEAQKRTEEQLASFEKKTEENFSRVWKAINELTEAQKRTEEQLASFEKKTEENFSRVWKAINELAEAQKRTEERLEGLSDTIGYSLENRAYKALPKILATYGLKVEGRLLRRYVKVGNKERQLNIYGYARRNGERLLVLGETKVRPSKKEIARFEKLCKKLEKQEGLPVFKIFVAHDFPPAIEKELSEKEILPIWSYDLE